MVGNMDTPGARSLLRPLGTPRGSRSPQLASSIKAEFQPCFRGAILRFFLAVTGAARGRENRGASWHIGGRRNKRHAAEGFLYV